MAAHHPLARFFTCTFTVLVTIVTTRSAEAQWVDFADETATRLSADAALAGANPDEKDYAWDDLDNDGDTDLVAVHKQLGTTTGRRRNVLFMNEGGVLVDRTNLYATASAVTLQGIGPSQGFLDETNDRDVVLADVDGDGWVDIITATTLSGGAGGTVGDKAISHPRVYMNLGDSPPGSGNWQGFNFDDVNRIPTLPSEPRFCSVSAGDLDGDNDIDLYFGDYQQPTSSARPVDLNDRLLLNDGSGYFTDATATCAGSCPNDYCTSAPCDPGECPTDPMAPMTCQMVGSSFAMSTSIADMNGDGRLDILKDDALNAPQGVSISYNNLAGTPGLEGTFDGYEIAYAFTPYHIATGDLNADGQLDMVITDDGLDYYVLNQGNGADGMADFGARQVLNGSVSEFGGNNLIVDLNNDGFNDVIVTSVDVDSPSCSTFSRLYRNFGDTPDVTLSEQGTVGIASGDLQGGHDIAAFDINGDGWKDLVIGTCSGTTVYMNQPPAGLTFSYPDGLPLFVPPGAPFEFHVQVTGIGASIPADGTGMIHVSHNGGAFSASAMVDLGSGLYRATLPAATCIDTFEFYFTAEDTGSSVFADPLSAPASRYSAIVAVGTAQSFQDDVEGPVASWTITNDGSLTGGGWQAAEPIGTIHLGDLAAPGGDAEASTTQVRAFVTENCPADPCDATAFDVDGGPTDLISPTFNLAGTDADISYFRWFFTDGADTMEVAVTDNGTAPTPTWVVVENVATTTGPTSTVWEAATFRVSDHITPSADVRVRFRVLDAAPASVVEAGIDLVRVEQFVCSDDCVDDADCDLDGLFCTLDTCDAGSCAFGGTPCPGQLCNEVADLCVECVVDADCDDNLFCNGSESCIAGACTAGADPCPTLTCDEASDSCVGCVNDADCDDSLFCNGPETCVGTTCIAGGTTGFTNGTFADNSNWTDNIPVGGTLTYASRLEALGANGGTGAFTWASQTVDLGGANLEFDLVSYTSGDSAMWDRPVIYIDGTHYGLNDDGTLGTPATLTAADFGSIDNANQVTMIHFVIDVEAIAGTGSHDLGFGVMSVDGQFGAGTAIYDNVTPAAGVGGDPCPGQLCDEVSDACVDCLDDASCDDGVFCNGVETCVGGACTAGSDPCPTLTCDEVNDICVGCLDDIDCNDSLFCNGVEVCNAGTCESAGGSGVANGTFDDGSSWTSNVPGDGTITFPGNLDVVGPGAAPGGYAWASQAGIDLLGGNLEFDLVSWTPTDIQDWDRPVVSIEGTFYGLNADGTLGSVAPQAQGAFGTIDNSNPIASPIHFSVDVEALVGAGPHDIGFGVMSVDGGAGAGTAVYDDVASGGGTPCPGQLCDEVADTCVDCLVNGDCDDSVFCNGVETCVAGACTGGSDLCPGQLCDEAADTCVDCLVNGDCDDSVFCNGVETCVAGACSGGSDPCPDQSCDEASDMCTGCLTNGDCNDPLFCNGVETCVAGTCTGGTDPCPGQLCDDGTDTCIDCVVDGDCDDSVFCNGSETCIGGACTNAGDPCPGQTCDESGDACFDCLVDADCDDGVFCNGNETCVAGACTSGNDPCAGLVCDDIRNNCVQCLTTADCGGGDVCCDNACTATACAIVPQPKPGDPITGLNAAELARFEAGKLAFDTVFNESDGLGPIFNQNSCASCHNNPVGGSGSITVTRFGIPASKGGAFDPLDALGGSLLQDQSISLDCAEEIPVEATIVATRATPSLLGFGLLEAIPDADILAGESSPSVSGRAHMVGAFEDPPGSPLRVGRFGWKAQVATVLTFSADAGLNEMGITNRFLLNENDPNGINPPSLGAPDNCDTVADPEDDGPVGDAFIDHVTDFQRFTAPPPQTPKQGMSGEALFASIGCTVCHTPGFTTANDLSLEAALRNKTARPYSDFLLHDMGLLFDGIVQGDAEAGEIRTPPLWGLRFRDPMLHDASVQGGNFETRVVQAITAHGLTGSEAKPSVDAFLALNPTDHDAVVAFLNSLGRCEFDDNGDGVVDHLDYSGFLGCFSGPGFFYTPDNPCSVHDIDCDGDVDDVDRSFFLIAVEDCCDLDGDDIRDNACTWCDNTVPGCNYIDISPAFADMGGSFGGCPPNGFANIHDRNLALTCFSGTTPCASINIDAGGAFGDCAPDGFCNVHDANHALAAFSGTTSCTCPAGPAPEGSPAPIDSAALRVISAQRSVEPGGRVVVRVFTAGPIEALRSYQLEMATSGGKSGAVELEHIEIENRKDHAFVGQDDRFSAFNVGNGTMLEGLEADHGRSVADDAYLATYVFRATADAAGQFVIELRFDSDAGDQTFLVAPGNGRIDIDGATSAIVTVKPDKRTR
jgi:hypothetical protein